MFLQISSISRKGMRDIWNAFMVEGASFTHNDIPICNFSTTVPEGLISYSEAKTLYNKTIKRDPDFKDNRFIHFYIDDPKFDGKESSVWFYPYESLKIIRHFAGIITPDFSTNCDFPFPIKLWNTYRMRAFGYWMNSLGIKVINNVRWGTPETYSYCFDGIPKGSTVAVGTVASGLKTRINRQLFTQGFEKMIEVINPQIIVIYGSANYTPIKNAEINGVKLIIFPSSTSLSYRKEAVHE